ncbi:MAG: cystathionine beta-lyase [Alphaproteobacteria bacterium]|nr:MAG: cystathionine beta-lyase [Alphaproteobacteria bacterium]
MKIDTKIVSGGRDVESQRGAINPAVYHASTVAFPSLAAFEAANLNRYNEFYYGRFGTPTSHALEDAIATLEGGGRTIAVGSGLGAITGALLAYLDAGDHALVADNVYAPVRNCCTRLLARLGIEVTYFDPMAPDGLAALIRPNSKVMFAETPGSLTFETPDIGALAAQAKAAGLTTILDNTWATPYFFRPLDHGIDVSIMSATKYIGGHADLMLGTLTVPAGDYDKVRMTCNFLSGAPGPDDCYLALRGLRTLSVRLRRHERNALALTTWLAARPEVDRVLYPALESAPGHANWKRDFSGSSGLFGVVLAPAADAAVAAMVDNLRHFAIGASWGGYESLITREYPARSRTATTWPAAGPVLRIHAGLEDPDDLIADLEAGLDRLRSAAP